MVENSWTNLDNQWYYADPSGQLAQNSWKKINGSWYYFDQTGSMLSNTSVDGYLLTNSEAMAENGWVKIDQNWYYVTPSGRISQDKWEKVNGSWYYFDKSGVMLSQTTVGAYLLGSSGAMAEKEWIFDKAYNSWFYLKANGTYAARE